MYSFSPKWRFQWKMTFVTVIHVCQELTFCATFVNDGFVVLYICANIFLRCAVQTLLSVKQLLVDIQEVIRI